VGIRADWRPHHSGPRGPTYPSPVRLYVPIISGPTAKFLAASRAFMPPKRGRVHPKRVGREAEKRAFHGRPRSHWCPSIPELAKKLVAMGEGCTTTTSMPRWRNSGALLELKIKRGT
jgi:hypothetical protein